MNGHAGDPLPANGSITLADARDKRPRSESQGTAVTTQTIRASGGSSVTGGRTSSTCLGIGNIDTDL